MILSISYSVPKLAWDNSQALRWSNLVSGNVYFDTKYQQRPTEPQGASWSGESAPIVKNHVNSINNTEVEKSSVQTWCTSTKRRLADRTLRAFFLPKSGGGSGIRTHDEVAPITVFKTVAFVHSAIPPYGGQPRHYRHENAL